MRKAVGAVLAVFLLCFCGFGAVRAEIPKTDLSLCTAEELNQIRADIDTENQIHHTVNSTVEDEVLRAVKAGAEEYYQAKGITVSWAWYDWEYSYTRDVDLLTCSTHLTYTGAGSRNRRVDVEAEVVWDGKEYRLYRLTLDGEQVFRGGFALPDSRLVDSSLATVNEATGINLSLLSPDELKELDKTVQREIDANHTPRDSGRVRDLVRKTVEASLPEGSAAAEWPRNDDEMTCDWDCYTETTRVSYELDGQKHRDERVYAEVFPDGKEYRVFYLEVGDRVVLDERAAAEDERALRFLRKRTYTEAARLLSRKRYDEAAEMFDSLGDFADSAEKAAQCREASLRQRYDEARAVMEAGEYDRAASLFEALGGYADSAEKAAQCREAALDLRYQAAEALRAEGSWIQAEEQFTALGDYRDSAEKAAECRAAFLDSEYKRAAELMDGERYAEAAAVFETLGGYADSAERALACLENVHSRDYARAEKLSASGRYEEAAEAFEALGDYRDSAERALENREIMTSIDRKITLTGPGTPLLPGGQAVLTPEVKALSESASETTAFVFTSADPAVARVDGDGTVTAVGPGETVIRCEAADNPRILAETSVRVAQSVSRVTLSADRAELSFPEQNGNGRVRLKVTFEPKDALMRTGTWTSADESVATVDRDGNVLAAGVGKTEITFTAEDDSAGVKSASCSVQVVQAVTSVTLAQTPETIYVGKTVQLKAAVQPANAANKKLVWTSGSASVAAVTSDGKVTGVAPGETVITAASVDGPAVRLPVTVRYQPVTLKVTATAKCGSRNHVGSKWEQIFTLNGEVFKGTAKADVENGDILTLGCTIRDNDADPDEEGFTETVEITPEILKKGTTIERTVTVTENEGPYAGNTADWKVVIKIKP